MTSFDPLRPDFAPYGFACDRWKPAVMKRADRHNEIELNFLKRGTLTYLLGGNTVTIPAGRLAAFWASIPHQIISTQDNAEYFVATIPLTWFLQYKFPASFVDTIMHAGVILDPSSANSRSDLEMFQRWADHLGDFTPQWQRIVFLEMEARLLRFALAVATDHPPGKSDAMSQSSAIIGGLSRIERIACFVAQHYTGRLTVEEIGAAVDLHPNYVMTLFKKGMGVTLVDFITQHRVSHAQRLLATTDMKVIDVSLNSGFFSMSRFYEAFQKSCGCSPIDYRRSHFIGELSHNETAGRIQAATIHSRFARTEPCFVSIPEKPSVGRGGRFSGTR